MCVMVLGLVSFFDSFSSLERRNGKSYERGEVKRRYSSFLEDFEKEYIFPLDCKGSAGWIQLASTCVGRKGEMVDRNCYFVRRRVSF